MINLDDLCVLDKPVKSMMESRFITTEWSKLNVDNNAKSFFKEAYAAGFLCPLIKIQENSIIFNFGIDMKYVNFAVLKDKILFTYGTLGKEAKTGIISDMRKQLKTLSDFIHPRSKSLC